MSTDRRGVPLLVGDLFPMLVPSVYTPIAGAPYLGKTANRLFIALGRSRAADPVTCARGFREFRAKLGLPIHGWNMIDGRLSKDSNVGLVPSAYLSSQPDWPANYRLVGFTPWVGR